MSAGHVDFAVPQHLSLDENVASCTVEVDNMQSLRSRPSVFCILVLLLSLALGYTWNPWNIFRRWETDHTRATTQRVAGHIAHRAASDTLQNDLRQDGAWYDSDGVPLFLQRLESQTRSHQC